jgi:hypothetical protein
MNVEIKNIINVYQNKYTNYELPIGFGDFLRGCLSMIQISKHLNIKCDIYINTPINKFLNNFKNNDLISINQIPIYYYTVQNTNFNDSNLHNLKIYYDYNNYVNGFISFCNSKHIYDGTLYILTNAYPITTISNDERNQVQYWIEPNNQLKNIVSNKLNEFNLTEKQYDIIHIRTGDTYLINNVEIDNNKLHYILSIIQRYINNKQKYILISDNNILNMYINKYENNIYTIINNKIHTGNSNMNDEDIQNTLVDFYIMSKSKSILSFSTYGHGSSFSKWCAEIYDIPIISYLF